MISPEKFQAILKQYEKHGWILRRVLLSAKVRLPLEFFGQVEIVSSESDALWFSRASAEGREAWELRSLADAPFALVEVFEAEDEEEVREEIRQEMQTRLAEQASKSVNRKVTD